ncbi:hypothetical protein LJY25_05385 [Hymenobacter sp. BT175]|uniref:hypothetical protein n=1 Tax=Hymenobacter translucens TaxID=2886507 RepID=UPI001D0F1AD3|nr:hypothetical protein [Hymenobacter translucens]MCC2545868.1 hypothetical protein [Hymenobacter translucens]
MKNTLTALLPALALLTLGGCAGTSALTSTESDGVYYSSKDRTSQVVSTRPATSDEPAPVSASEEANPEYRGSSQSARSSGSTEYYDDDYSYSARIRRFHQPYRGLSLGYYDFAYVDPFFYGASPYAWGPAGYYNSFYDPFFYDPFRYGYGSPYVSVTIGYGRPYYPYAYYRPYGYGYYDSFYGYGRGYGGYYGSRYGNRNYGSGYVQNPRNQVYYGPRQSRSGEATSTGGTVRNHGGRLNEGGLVAPNPGSQQTSSGVISSGSPAGPGKSRVQEAGSSQQSISQSGPDRTIEAPVKSSPERPSRLGRVYEATPDQSGAPAPDAQPQIRPDAYGQGRRIRVAEEQPAQMSTLPQDYAQPQQPQPVQPQRRRSVYGGDQQAPEQPATRPQRRVYRDSGEQPQRSYSEPSRSYSQPSSQPSSSPAPSGGRGGRGRIE